MSRGENGNSCHGRDAPELQSCWLMSKGRGIPYLVLVDDRYTPPCESVRKLSASAVNSEKDFTLILP